MMAASGQVFGDDDTVNRPANEGVSVRGKAAAARPFPAFFGALGYCGVCFVVVAVLIELACFGLLSAWRKTHPTFYSGHCRGTGNGSCPDDGHADLNLNSASPAYDNSLWAESYFREERWRWRTHHYAYAPFRLWRIPSWHGRFTNFDDTQWGVVRRTSNPARECGRTIWMFGGSTMMGQGAPDDLTLASYVSKLLNSRPESCVSIVNFGVDGYNSNQELLFLLELLKNGGRPTAIVLYEGVNETSVGGFVDFFHPGIPSAHLDLDRIRTKLEDQHPFRTALVNAIRESYSGRVLSKIRQRAAALFGRPPARFAGADEPPKRAVAILDNWEKNIATVRALGRVYGFRCFFFWQPMLLYGSKPIRGFEANVAASVAEYAPVWRASYEEAERRACADYVFLGHVFDRTDLTVYIDASHLGPDGNEIVARSIAAAIEETATAGESGPPSGANAASRQTFHGRVAEVAEPR